MKTPDFWQSQNTFSSLLVPFAALYEMASTVKNHFATAEALPVPVICVGNLTVGGAGKTPVALLIGKWFKDKGIRAFFLSRGYGGSLTGPALVDVKIHTVKDVGDEPLLLSQILPCVIAKNRLSGGKFAVAQGAQVIIMDDGFQNPTIAKTLSLVVIDGQFGFGNGLLLPAGPLRETPESGFRRAHAVIIINPTSASPMPPANVPLLTAKTSLQPEALSLKGKKLLAFCGIALPQKFFEQLTKVGALLVDRVAFADHYLYSENDLQKLKLRAAKQGAELVCTAKDAMRIPPQFRTDVMVADMVLCMDRPELLDALLSFALKRS